MDIGEPRKIIEVEPATIPVPETIPLPETDPTPDPGPRPADPGRAPSEPVPAERA
jgi:hypothetical protein